LEESESKIIIEKESITIIFQDLTSEDDILDMLKDGDELTYDIKILVYNQNEKIAQYRLEYDWSIGTARFHHFVSKFLINPDYRRQFIIEGEWEEKLEYTTPTGYRINPICRKGIDEINRMKNTQLRFKHFANLKTGGVDGFSRLKFETLHKMIPQRIIDQIKTEEMDESMTLNCLRWIARGLRPQRAIRKVKTDAEIRNNIR